MDALSNTLGKMYRSVATSFMSLPTESHFLEKGTLTPEEFVLAGDQLTFRCPTWSWQASVPGQEQGHLPPNKQFLITRDVPCRKRIKQALDQPPDYQEREEEGWIVTEFVGQREEIKEMELDEPVQKPVELPEPTGDIPDLSDLEDEGMEEDPNAYPSILMKGEKYLTVEEPEDHILKTRTYDLSVTYDTYYHTPRLWLMGYDEYHNPLTPVQIFEDVMDDYSNKTVTMETHPCLGNAQASIHPCNHAKMMKHFIDILAENGTEAKVQHAMFVFLKFLSSVVPTIEYDFTMDLSLE
jgi:ubiquitin-like-conjugating enzyme ATG3